MILTREDDPGSLQGYWYDHNGPHRKDAEKDEEKVEDGAGRGANESCETRFDAVAREAVAFGSCKRQGNRLSPGPPHLWEPQH